MTDEDALSKKILDDLTDNDKKFYSFSKYSKADNTISDLTIIAGNSSIEFKANVINAYKFKLTDNGTNIEVSVYSTSTTNSGSIVANGERRRNLVTDIKIINSIINSTTDSDNLKDVVALNTGNMILTIIPIASKTFFNSDPFITCKATLSWSIPEVERNEYKFRPGLNVVQFNSSGKLTITPDTDFKGMIVFSDLNIINKSVSTSIYGDDSDGGLDLSLAQYQAPNRDIPPELQLLIDMREADPDLQFLYGIKPSDSRLLDLNASRLLVNDDTETLLSPSIWYAADNECNKFVISEIDSTYLDTGIQLSRSSKK